MALIQYTRKVLLAAFMTSIGCSPETDRAPAPLGLMELRFVETTQSEGSQPTMMSGELLNLASTPLVSEDDVESIDPVFRRQQLILSITLTQAADRRLRAATGDHIGERLAFVFDGRDRSAPVIAGTIGGTPLQVSLDATQAEADSMVAAIHSRWP